MSENFETIEARLCAYVEGELDEQGQAEIEKHLEANPHHRRLLDELSAQRTLLRRLPRESAPAELAESFNGQLERAALLKVSDADAADGSGGAPAMRISRWPQYAAVAAVVLLAAGLGVMIYLAVPRGAHPDYAITGAGEGKAASRTLRGDANDQVVPPDADDGPGQTRGRSDLDSAGREGENLGRRSDMILGKGGDAILGKREAEAPVAAATQGATESNVAAKETSAAAAGLDAVQLVETRLAENPDAIVVVVTSRDPRATTGRVADFLTRNEIRWTDAANAGAVAEAPPLNPPNAVAKSVEPAPAQQEVAALKRQTAGDSAAAAVAEQQAGRAPGPEAARGPAQLPAKAQAPAAQSPAAEPTGVAKAAQRPEEGSQPQQQQQQQPQQANADQQLNDWAARNQAANAAATAATNNARPTGENAIVARMTRQQAQALQLSLANQAGQRAQLYPQANAYRAAQQQQQLQQLQQQQLPTVELQAQGQQMRQADANAATPPPAAPYGGRANPGGVGGFAGTAAAPPPPNEVAKRDEVVRDSAAPPENGIARRGVSRERESLPSAGATPGRQQDVAARSSAPAPAPTTQPAFARAPAAPAAPARPLARGAEPVELQQQQARQQQPPQQQGQTDRFAGTNAPSPSRAADVRAQMEQRQPASRPAAIAAGAPIQVGDELVVTLRGPSAGLQQQQQPPQTLRGRVAEDGTIQLPRLDAFACAGLTPSQAAQVIARKYQLADGAAAAVPAVNVERVAPTAPSAAVASRGMANVENDGAASPAPDARRARAEAGGVAGAAPGSQAQADGLRARSQSSGYGRNSGARAMTSAGAGGGGQNRAAQDDEFVQQQRQQDRSGAAGLGAQVGQGIAGGGGGGGGGGGNATGSGAAPATRPANLTAGQLFTTPQPSAAAASPDYRLAVPQTQEAAAAAPADQSVDVLILVKDEAAEDNAAPTDAAPGASAPQDRGGLEAVPPTTPLPTTRPAAAR